MYEFELAESAASEDVTGTAESADGRVKATLDRDGRLQELYLAPAILQRGRDDNTAMDSEELATVITRTINAALDDLAKRHATGLLPDPAAALSQLDQVANTFTSQINQLAADLERAGRRTQARD